MEKESSLLNDPTVPPKPQFTIVGLFILTGWVAVMLTLPNWWWRVLCIVEVTFFLCFVEYVVMDFPVRIQKAIDANTIRLDGSVSKRRIAIENAALRNFKRRFLFQVGCILAAINVIGLVCWLSNPVFENMQDNFEAYSEHPNAGSGLLFQPEFRIGFAALLSLFLLFVGGGAIYFHMLSKLGAGIERRNSDYRQYDIENLDRKSKKQKSHKKHSPS